MILSKTQITCRHAMRFLGKVNHAVQAVPEALLHFRIFQRQLISIYRNQFDLFKLYTVSEMPKEDLIWCANLKESSCTMSLLEPQAQTVVESDASRTGWGAIHEGVLSSGIWRKEVSVSHHMHFTIIAPKYKGKWFRYNATIQQSCTISRIKVGGPNLSHFAIWP